MTPLELLRAVRNGTALKEVQRNGDGQKPAGLQSGRTVRPRPHQLGGTLSSSSSADEFLVRCFIASRLRESGYVVIETESGGEASLLLRCLSLAASIG